MGSGDISFDAVFDPPPPLEPEIAEAPLPAIADLDTAPVARSLAIYDREVDMMVSRAQAVVVSDQESLHHAVECASGAKRLNGTIEKLRKHYVEAPNKFVRAVNNLAKRYQDKLVTIETGLKRKISDYQYQVELERRKVEAAAREEARKLQERMDAEAKAASEKTGEVVEAPLVSMPVIPEKATTTRTEAGSASQRSHWTFQIEDATQVPREYLMVDDKAIRQAIKAGVRNIPGVRIFEEFTTVIR